jgi:hypothetical protein
MMLTMSLSCSKSEDDIVVTPPREYAVQYATDLAVIESYLNKYTYTINSANDINFLLHTASSLNPKLKDLPTSGSVFPQLHYKFVELHDLPNGGYKVYYIVFNEGNQAKKPSRVDDVFTAYRGFYLENQSGVLGSTLDFDNNPSPTNLFSLTSVVRGWTEIFPLFGTGTVDSSASVNDPVVYQNYGVGAIFIPSGLGYFDREIKDALNIVKIPSYSPLVFTFKLYDLKRSDLDANADGTLGDGILSIDEDLNNNGIFTDDDSDVDGIPDYRDNDDDNDGYTTRNEIKKTGTGTYYLFNDIPDCSGNFSSPTRIRKHLDKNCH